MKTFIAKLLIATMVLTTVVMPVDYAFAETSTEVQVDETTPTIVEQQDTNANETDAEEVVTEEMKFLYVDYQTVEAPGTQNIAVSWKDDIDSVTKMMLVYVDGNGIEAELEECERTDTSILFTKTFDKNQLGTYTVKGIKYFVGEVENYLDLDDVEIDATFEVVDEETEETQVVQAVEENIVTLSDTGIVANTEALAVVENQVAEILEQAEVEQADVGNKRVIVLDPGHGGTDPGASKSGVKESEVNLKIAQACYDELIQYAGVEVYMTRTKASENPSLENRVKFAKSVKADVFVSIHNNAAGSSSAKGAEVWTPNKNYKYDVYEEGQAISKNILNELVALGLYKRGVYTRDSETKPKTKYKDGSVADYYYVIKECKKAGITGIIVEHAFITNKSDRAYLSKDSNLKKMGIADANGIVKYFGLKKGKWVTTTEGKKYQYVNGSYAVGYIRVGEYYYYFDTNGVMKTGAIKINGKPYYFATSGKGVSKGWYTYKNGTKVYSKGSGVLATGYYKISGSYYYFNSSGAMKKYTQMVGGKPYYFKSNGKAASKGWLYPKKNTKKYCYGKGKLAVGYKKIGKYYYGFDSKGVMLKGTKVINGKPYYFKSDGKGIKKGWIKFKSGAKKYSYGRGVLAKGYKKIGQSYYYFNETGTMQKYSQTIDGKPYYFKKNGKAIGKGWIKFKSGTKKYCTGKGKLAVGYKKIGKYYYGFNSKGAMLKYSQTIKGKPYYFKKNGKGAGKGWIKFSSGSRVYCLGNGKLATGTVKIGKTYYDFASNGKYLGKTVTTKYAISGKSSVTVNQMVAYYKSKKNAYPSAYKKTEASTIEKLCKIYYDECAAEGIKVEVAFCQAMKETGWLKYGGDVKIEQYNFAGLGATGGGNPGNSFETVTIGVRAHVQHLKAYANTEPLVNECVDLRFDLVKRGTAKYVEWLGINANPDKVGWAPAATYGTDIVKMIKEMKSY